MNRQDRSAFVSGYSKAVTKAWSDKAFMAKLNSDPAGAFKEVGFNVPAGLKVTVITKVAGKGTLEDQIKIWEAGLKAGKADLYVPDTPQLKEGELSDSQLEAVAGGADCCCSCTPCCCCT